MNVFRLHYGILFFFNFLFISNSFSQNYVVPLAGSQAITTCSGTVTDHAGTSSYSNNASGTLVIEPSNPGSYIKLDFSSFSTEGCCDFLSIYDGATVSDPLIGTYSGSSIPGIVYASNISGKLTLRFITDGSIISSGFSANISCVTAIPGKDLTVTSASLSASTVVAGNSLSAFSTLRNVGTGTASAHSVACFLSQDSVYDGSDLYLASSSITSLASGASTTRSLNLTIPSNTVAGNYYIIVYEDYLNQVVEDNEQNNTFMLPIIIVSPDIDLSILIPSVNSTSLAIGGSFTPSCKILNSGTTTSPSSNVGYYLSVDQTWDSSDVFLGVTTGTTLSPNVSSTRSSVLTIPANTVAGSYYIVYYADYLNQEIERTKANNFSFLAVTISNAFIDLIVQNPKSSSSSVVPGTTLSLNSYIYNQGNFQASSSNIGYYLSSDTLYSASDLYLAASNGTTLSGSTSSYRTSSVYIPGNTVVGNYYILFYADHLNGVLESNELNNIQFVPLRVEAPGIDLTIQTGSVTPSEANAGYSVVVNCAIKNLGNTSASSSNIGYYLSADTVFDASDTYLGNNLGSSLAAKSSSNRSASILIPSSTPAGDYYLICFADYSTLIVETNESNNTFSIPIKVSATALTSYTVPYSGTTSITACSGVVYDHAGASMQYSNYANGTLTINPATPGSYVSLTIATLLLDPYGYDYLTIYDGSSTSAPIIGQYSMSTSNAFTVYATNVYGALTLKFYSNSYTTADGFVAYIGCSSAYPLPDLTVNQLSLSSYSIVSGSSITGFCDVKNDGLGIAASTILGAYLSTDTLFDASDVLIGFSSVSTLSSGAISTRTPSLIIPSNLNSGNYYVLYFADHTSLITESSEINNVGYVPIAITEANIDLSILNSSVTPNVNVASGSNVSSSFSVMNSGYHISPSTNVGFYLSLNDTLDTNDLYLGSSIGYTLLSGTVAQRTATVAIPSSVAPGSYYLISKIDYLLEVKETNESNNTSSIPVTIAAPFIDLIIQSPALSSNNVINGGMVTATCSIINQGNFQASSSNVGYYLSTDTLFNASDIYLNYSSGGTLNAAGSSNKTSTLNIPSNTPVGNYYILFFADYQNLVLENNEINNVNWVPITVSSPYYDLYITGTGLSTSSVVAGNSTLASCNINNGGNSTATSSAVGYYLSSDTIWSASDTYLSFSSGGALSSGGYSYRSSNVIIPSSTVSGNYYILYYADHLNQVNESNESNNVAYYSITVTQPQIDLFIQNTVLTPNTVVAGGSVSVSCSITNNGNSPASSSAVAYYLSSDTIWDIGDLLLNSSTGGSLSNGSSATKSSTLNIPSNTVPGGYFILYYADYNNLVMEVNENNNVASKSVTISPATVDLTITYPFLFSTPTPGSTINTDYYVNNLGNSSASSSNVAYYLSADTLFDAGDLLLGNTTGGSISGNNLSYRTASVNFPSSVIPGGYYLIYYVDYQNAVTEINETNNTAYLQITVNNPNVDLTITSASISGSSSIAAGAVALVQSVISNIGNTQASSSNIGYYLSSNSTWDASDIYLSASNGTSLTGGATSSRSHSVTIPSSTIPGIYYLICFVDYSLLVTESNELNNFYSIPITIVDPSSILTVPFSGTQTVTTCTGNVFDNGGASNNYQNGSNGVLVINPGTSGAKVRLIFSVFDVENGYDYLEIFNGTSTASPSLGVFSINPGTITATGASGALTLKFVSDGSVNMQGFAAAISCIGGVTPLADLVITSQVLSTTNVLPGSSVNASCSILNQGNLAASGSKVGYYHSIDSVFDASDVLLGFSTGGNLTIGASESRSNNITIPQNLAPGNSYILFVADYLNEVIESSETNNVKYVLVNYTGLNLADLLVKNISLSSNSLKAGDVIDVSYMIENIGSMAVSSPFTVAYLLSQDTLWNLGDEVIGYTNVSNVINPSGKVILSEMISVPVHLNNGSFNYVLVYLDFFQQISELTKSNNIGKVAVSFLTDIENKKNEQDKITIYPNPFQSIINIDFPLNGIFNVAVEGLSGALVFQKEINNLNHSIDLSGLPNGIYFLRIKNDEVNLVKKIIKLN